MSWNKAYDMVMKIKSDYVFISGRNDNYNLKDMITYLNLKKYNDFAEPLQINQNNEFILLRYGLQEMQRGLWDDKDSIYRQCRSLVIDMKNDKIVLATPKKFFNLDEVEENMLNVVIKEIEKAKIVEFSDKLDGSMQSYRWYDNKVFGAGSMALDSNNSWRLAYGFNMLTNNHINMLKDNPDITFVFEFISKKDSHVVNYKKEQEGLHLLIMVNNTTGEEYSYSKVIETANKYNIKVVDLENLTIDDALLLSKKYKSEEKEGWVLNIDGHRIKIKCDDYVKLHRILDKLSSVNLIIECIADNKFDDLISKIPETHRSKVYDLSNKIYEYINETNKLIDDYFIKGSIYQDRKYFMQYVDKVVPVEIRQYVKDLYLKKDYNLLKSRNGSYKKIKEILGSDYELKIME